MQIVLTLPYHLSTPKKVCIIPDLYNHSGKKNALIADHQFEPELAFLALGSPSTTLNISNDPLTINDALLNGKLP